MFLGHFSSTVSAALGASNFIVSLSHVKCLLILRSFAPLTKFSSCSKCNFLSSTPDEQFYLSEMEKGVKLGF